MPKAKTTSGSTQLTYANGVTVSVSAEKAERLRSNSAFTAAKATAKAPAKADDK